MITYQIQRGFTLIEIMVVVAIIAILASIALPSYQNYIKKAAIQEAQSNLVGLSLSAESAFQRQLAYPLGNDATSDDVHERFSTWNATSDKFNYQYDSADGTAYTLTATGAANSNVTGCVLTLDNEGAREIAGCDPITEWVR